VVGKRKASRYVPGTRSADWLKIKPLQTAKFLIVGYLRNRWSAILECDDLGVSVTTEDFGLGPALRAVGKKVIFRHATLTIHMRQRSAPAL
jgi:hypothetical protein